METREVVRSRIALALPEDRTHGQMFVDTLAGFAELHGPEVAEEARAAATVSVELGLFNCPMGELLRITDAGVSAAEARGFGSYPEVLERLGEYLGDSYIRSPVGQAFRRLTGGDMMKSVEMSTASTRAVTTYGNRRVEVLGPTSARLIFRGELMGPLWIRGIYTRIFRSLYEIASVSAIVERYREPGVDFDLVYTWKLR